MVYIHKNIEEDNLKRERKILVIFDSMLDDMLSNKNLQLGVT